MTGDPVDLIARAVLYEGYLLYPYRPSALKNRQRFTFGVLYPEAFCRARPDGSDAWQLRAECPVRGGGDARLAVEVRFLQLVGRQDPFARTAEAAIERRVGVDAGRIEDLIAQGGVRRAFAFDPVEPGEPAPGGGTGSVGGPEAAGAPAEEAGVRGEVRVDAVDAGPGVWKLTVRVANLSSIAAGVSRDEALEHSLASTHAVMRVEGGELVSLTDPPDALRDVAAMCANAGVWPVLVGEEGSRDCMLASPIILYDHPQIAPESAGDLFDGTEIDEILALRILTMTDEEKREARESDERARQILDRTEALEPEHWARLHGAIRGLRHVTGRTP